MKIFELAKELNVECKDIMRVLERNSAMNVLLPEEIEKAKLLFSKAPIETKSDPVKAPLKGNDSWKADDENKFNFTPSNLLKVKLKDPAWKEIWTIDTKARSKVQKRLDEGWKIATYADIKSINAPTMQDSQKSLTTQVRKREMVLMMASRKLVESRRKFYEPKENKVEDFQESFKEKVRAAGGHVIGSAEVDDMPTYRHDPSISQEQSEVAAQQLS